MNECIIGIVKIVLYFEPNINELNDVLTTNKIFKPIIDTTFSRLRLIYKTGFSSDLRMSIGRFQIESRNRIIDKYVINSGVLDPKIIRDNFFRNK